MLNIETLREFSGQDAPHWFTEADCSMFCSFLNFYLPTEHRMKGTRFHSLNRYPGGRLYIHLLER